MSGSPRILTGDQEIAQFLKVSVAHIRRHGDDIPVIRKLGNIRITSEEALQAFLLSGIEVITVDEEEENKRERPVSNWQDTGAIASAGKRRRVRSVKPTS